MTDATDALVNEIGWINKVVDFTPANAVEAMLVEKLVAATRVLDMIANLKDNADIGGRSYAQSVDIAHLKANTVLAFRTPGTLVDLDKVLGNV